MKHHYEDDRGVTLYHGDCIEVMRTLPDSSVHAVITDPPYGLEFMGADWDSFGRETSNGYRERPRITDRPDAVSAFAGHGGQGVNSFQAGRPFQDWCEIWAREASRVLKPGGYMLAFGGSRTWHRLAAAVEDAGFEIRDSIAWLYGSGFPKGVNLTGEFEGWGTGLKPAFEPIVVGRKPLGQTVAASMAEHGTGAIHIGATRVGDGTESRTREGEASAGRRYTDEGAVNLAALPGARGGSPDGRWPTNVLLDQSQANELDAQTGVLTSGKMPAGTQKAGKKHGILGAFKPQPSLNDTYGDSGGASRFFPTFQLSTEDAAWQARMEQLPTFHYEAKAPGTERPDVDGVKHPTVKPLELMRWLVRLVASPGAVILEPFAGSGTTLEACLLEGFQVIGIERDESYLPLIMQRITKPLQQSLFGAFE